MRTLRAGIWRGVTYIRSSSRMASSTAIDSPSRIYEGVFAINKPPDISSAQVIRDVQSHFKSSPLFEPWLAREQARKDAESHNQQRKRRSWKERQPLQVKMGHGGTLDPMATGVLILGVGNGTKELGAFLECTKSYEAVMLFGVATDSYDAVGKVVARKPYQHVTKEAVEEALEKFRGSIMQRPPVFSALRVQGKRLYEYAREGKEVPVEIEEREVVVESLELVEWMDGTKHEWHWPTEEADQMAKQVAQKTLQLSEDNGNSKSSEESATGAKRKRTGCDGNDYELEQKAPTSPKRLRASPPLVDGGQGSSVQTEGDISPNNRSDLEFQNLTHCPAPACRLRMTVTSGFYVRSLCHDLGAAVGSLGIMSSLVRTRQGDFDIGRNVLEYSDLEQGREVWEPKVMSMLEAWEAQSQNGKPEDSRDDINGNAQRVSSPRRGQHRKNTSSIVTSKIKRRNSSSDEG